MIFKNKCCNIDSLEAARKTAQKLEIPFYVVNFFQDFQKEIVDYFFKKNMVMAKLQILV